MLRRLDPRERTLCLIDSLPLPVAGFAHACGNHRWDGEAAYGYNAAKKQTFYSVKLPLCATQTGLILDFALVPATRTDGDLAAPWLSENDRLIVLGDKASLISMRPCSTSWPGAPTSPCLVMGHDELQDNLQHLLAWRTDLTFSLHDAPAPRALSPLLSALRQAMEPRNAQLAGQFQIECARATSLFGLCVRVQAKLCAHTVGVYLTYLLDQPLRALAALNVI